MYEWSKKALLDNEELHCIGCCLVMPKILDIYAYINYWRLYIPLRVCVCICIHLYMQAPSNKWENSVFGPGHMQKKKEKMSEDEVMVKTTNF